MHNQQQQLQLQRQQPAKSKSNQQLDAVQSYLASIEPDNAKLEQDLAHLAAYMVKIGTNVDIGRRKFTKSRLLKHPELDVDSIQAAIVKYKLTFKNRCERSGFDQESNRCLFHVAQSYTAIFLECASKLSPGTYAERRFWWCAGNFNFFEQQQRPQQTSPDKIPSGDSSNRFDVDTRNSPNLLSNGQDDISNLSPNLRSSLVMSDVLCNVLSTNESKMIVLNALHLSVKYSNFRVHLDWFKRNRAWIFHQIAHNRFHQNNPRAWLQLRRTYRVQEFERNLSKVDVERFIERWNLTGLRPPEVKEYLHSFCELIKG